MHVRDILAWARWVLTPEAPISLVRGHEHISNVHRELVGGRQVADRQALWPGWAEDDRREKRWRDTISAFKALEAKNSMRQAVAAHWSPEVAPVAALPTKRVSAAKDPAMRSLLLSLLKQDGVDGTLTKVQLGRLWSNQAAACGGEQTGKRLVEAMARDGLLEIDEGTRLVHLVPGAEDNMNRDGDGVAIRRPCIVSGCPEFAVGGPRGARCKGCQAVLNQHAARDPRRAAYRDPGYTSWRYPKGTPCALKIPGVCTGEGNTKDHIVPLIDGGSNHPSNLQPACRECNSSKRDR